MTGEKITCRTPTPGKKPIRILEWKYDLIRSAILTAVPEGAHIPFKNLSNLVSAQLSPEQIESVGSISWYTTTVKLDMEVNGELERIEGVAPQQLRRTTKVR
jgi:hypothetical protein